MECENSQWSASRTSVKKIERMRWKGGGLIRKMFELNSKHVPTIFLKNIPRLRHSIQFFRPRSHVSRSIWMFKTSERTSGALITHAKGTLRIALLLNKNRWAGDEGLFIGWRGFGTGATPNSSDITIYHGRTPTYI